MKNADITNQTKPNLIQLYTNSAMNLTSMKQAEYEARRTEQDLLQGLSGLGASNGVYLTPADIPAEIGEQVVKDSVNAHLTKIQSQQISSATLAEVSRAEAEAKKYFVGRKVTISIIDPNTDVVDAVYLDKNSSNYRTSKYNSRKLKGTIVDLSFPDNLLVIKPTHTARFIVPNRVLFYVYVINMTTMSPNISV